MRKILFAASLVLLFGACAHHKDVRAGVDGIHTVMIQTDDTDAAAQDAIKQANHYCESRDKNKQAAFLEESAKYTGDIDEGTYKNAKRASSVAKTVGSGVYVFGGKRESDVGGLATLGGTAADNALGKGYTVKMRFKCQ